MEMVVCGVTIIPVSPASTLLSARGLSWIEPVATIGFGIIFRLIALWLVFGFSDPDSLVLPRLTFGRPSSTATAAVSGRPRYSTDVVPFLRRRLPGNPGAVVTH